MRILIFNQVAAPVAGEMNRYVLDVAAHLRSAGDTVALVHGRAPKSEFLGTGYVFDHLHEGARNDREVAVRLNAIVEDFLPDVIQIHGVGNLNLDAMLAEKAPTVRFIHNHLFYCSGRHMTWQLPRKICECRHERNCLVSHYAHRCGSLNPAANFFRYNRVTTALAALKKLQGVQVASRVIRDNLMRNGIDPARIELLPLYSPAPVGTKPNVAGTRRMILHPGGLVPNKGVWLMAKSIDELPADVEIVFSGGGSLQNALEDYIKANNLSERIRTIGELTLEQLSHLYAQATVVVMPSMWNEPLGLSGMHAMAHGKPVVAFQSEGIREWLQNGHTGVAVPFADRKAFVQTLEKILSQPAKLEEMGAAGLEVWKQKFQPSQHLKRLRACYTKIAAEWRAA